MVYFVQQPRIAGCRPLLLFYCFLLSESYCKIELTVGNKIVFLLVIVWLLQRSIEIYLDVEIKDFPTAAFFLQGIKLTCHSWKKGDDNLKMCKGGASRKGERHNAAELISKYNLGSHGISLCHFIYDLC